MFSRMLINLIVLCSVIVTCLPCDPGDDRSSFPSCTWKDNTTDVSLMATLSCFYQKNNEEFNNVLEPRRCLPTCTWRDNATDVSLIAIFSCLYPKNDEEFHNDLETQPCCEEKKWKIVITRDVMGEHREPHVNKRGANKKRKKRFSSRSVYDDVLTSYVQYRLSHGYGRHVNRWGRDLRHQEQQLKNNNKNMDDSTKHNLDTTPKHPAKNDNLDKLINKLQSDSIEDNDINQNMKDTPSPVNTQRLRNNRSNEVKSRSRRAAGRSSYSRNMVRVLRNYKSWRNKYGYGKPIPGRWG